MNSSAKSYIKHHIVFCQNDNVILDEYVNYVFKKLKKNRNNLGFKLIKLEKINTYKPIDGKYNTPLNLTGVGSVIAMYFESQEDLKIYYEKILHSDIRREVYEKLNPKVIKEYKSLDKLMLNTKSNKKDIVELFNKIEKKMKKFILRFDFYPPNPL